MNLGYLIIFSVDNELTEEDMENAKVLSKALIIILNSPNALSDSILDLTDFTLKTLVKGEEINTVAILELSQKKYFTVLSASLPTGEKGKSYVLYIREQIVNKNRYIRCFLYGGNLFILIAYDQLEDLYHFYDHITPILTQYQMVAGASNHFTDIDKLKIYVSGK